MHIATTAISLTAACLGHFAITVWLFNRLHALGWPRPLVKSLEKVLLVVALGVLFVLIALPLRRNSFEVGHSLLSVYVFLCWLASILIIPFWLIPKLLERTPAALFSNDTTVINVADRLGFRPVQGKARVLSHVPGNQILEIAIQQKTLNLPTLPEPLNGLRIAHLSDLHMTGQLGPEFYGCIVDQTNALAPDIVVVTGDILEKEHCLPWIVPTLGRLQSRYGKFFILGNHEQRLRDTALLRRALHDAGLSDLGSKTQKLAINGVQVFLAGNERPWFGFAPELPDNSRQNSGPNPQPSFRILLSHTPDNLSWAKYHGFDLMLAGHTHGGQIRLPWLGAIIAPSFHGFRYAGGLYFDPPTLMHVSRGLAGIHPIRLNCRPELALLILKR
jgi:predicted MPP superfamily phosphohydrolase